MIENSVEQFIERIIGGVGSPYGEGAEYDTYVADGARCADDSHLDESGKVALRKDLKTLIRKVRKQVVLETLEQVIKEVAVEAAKLDEKTISKPTA